LLVQKTDILGRDFDIRVQIGDRLQRTHHAGEHSDDTVWF